MRAGINDSVQIWSEPAGEGKERGGGHVSALPVKLPVCLVKMR